LSLTLKPAPLRTTSKNWMTCSRLYSARRTSLSYQRKIPLKLSAHFQKLEESWATAQLNARNTLLWSKLSS
jgi:hypothetical protein